MGSETETSVFWTSSSGWCAVRDAFGAGEDSASAEIHLHLTDSSWEADWMGSGVPVGQLLWHDTATVTRQQADPTALQPSAAKVPLRGWLAQIQNNDGSSVCHYAKAWEVDETSESDSPKSYTRLSWMLGSHAKAHLQIPTKPESWQKVCSPL